MKTQGRRERKPWKSHPKTFQKAVWKTTPTKHPKLNGKWLQSRLLFRIVFHVLLHRGECFAGSRFLIAFIGNAFSSPGPCFSSLFGPSLFSPLSLKFIMGALGVPWVSPGLFWTLPGHLHGRPRGPRARPWLQKCALMQMKLALL